MPYSPMNLVFIGSGNIPASFQVAEGKKLEYKNKKVKDSKPRCHAWESRQFRDSEGRHKEGNTSKFTHWDRIINWPIILEFLSNSNSDRKVQ